MSHGPSGRRRALLALIGYYAYRAAVAWLLAYPLAHSLGHATAHLPGGDQALFESGALLLVEALSQAAEPLRGLATTTLLTSLVAALLGLVPLWWLMVQLRRPHPPPKGPGARRQLSAFVGLALLFSVGRLLTLALIGSLGLSAYAGLNDAADERWPETALGLLVGLCAAGWLASAALHDLARAVVVRRGSGALEALGLCVRAAGRNGPERLRSLLYYALTALSPAGLVPLTELAAQALDAGELGLRVGVHQLTAFSVLGLRALWLRHASLRADDLERRESASLSGAEVL